MEQEQVILGVDTHLDVHVGVAIDVSGRLLGTLCVPTNASGYLQLLRWARSYGHLCRAGLEGTGTYGAGLARVLREHGIQVLEINRPDRSARRRQESQIRQMQRAPHAPYLQVRQAPSPKNNQEWPRPCAPYWWPGAVL